MIDPNYTCNYSLMENKVYIHGNVELASTLARVVKEKYISNVDLYEAQESMRSYCIDTYGSDFYKNNAEAISFIIENEYCHAEREKLPHFGKKRYQEDKQKGIMY